jgi:hypothetical protein
MRQLVFALTVLFFSACQTETNPNNCLTDAEKAEGWQLLFNGKTLDGWKNYNGDDSCQGWAIEDGCMASQDIHTDHGVDIITKKEYTNFELSLEWKMTPEGNSGIFYHAKEDSANPIYMIAPEYQLLDDIGWGDKVINEQKAGANYAMNAPGQNKKLNPVGEFNVAKIVVKDSLVQHWLNGEKIVEYKLWDEDWQKRKMAGKWKDAPLYGSARSGFIGLQNHGKKVYIRNVKIKEL